MQAKLKPNAKMFFFKSNKIRLILIFKENRRMDLIISMLSYRFLFSHPFLH